MGVLTLRVVHVIPSLGPGGAERVVTSLALGQQRAGYDVGVLTQRARTLERDALLEGGVKLIEWGGVSRAALVARSGAWLAQSRSDLASADVLHMHLTFGSAFGAVARLLRAIGLADRPVYVETDHATGMRISTKTRVMLQMASWRTDALVSVMRGVTPSIRTSRRTLRATIPNGIEPLPIRESWQGGSPLRLGSLGLLRPDRQPEMYLELVRELTRSVDLTFTYGGEGTCREDLARQAREMELSDNVRFAGLVTDKEQFFTSLDAHVSIAVGDDVGLASLEAASTATPSFALQIVQGGRCHDSPIPTRATVTDLADVIGELVATSDRRLALGTYQAAYVRNERSIEQMVDSYADVYEACLRRMSTRR